MTAEMLARVIYAAPDKATLGMAAVIVADEDQLENVEDALHLISRLDDEQGAAMLEIFERPEGDADSGESATPQPEGVAALSGSFQEPTC